MANTHRSEDNPPERTSECARNDVRETAARVLWRVVRVMMPPAPDLAALPGARRLVVLATLLNTVLAVFASACAGTVKHGAQPVVAERKPPGSASGYAHLCLVRKGKVWCWGPFPPMQIRGVSDAVQVSNGVSHSCAVVRDGRVLCWTLQRDDGEVVHPDHVVVRPVPGLGDAVQVSAGAHVTCALRSNETVVCWSGDEAPQAVSDLERIVQVETRGCVGVTEAGGYYLNRPCALDVRGRAWCFDRSGGEPQLVNPSQPVRRLSEGCSRAVVLADGRFVPDLLPSDLTVIALDDRGWGRSVEGVQRMPARDYPKLGQLTRMTDRCGIVQGRVRCWQRYREGRLRVLEQPVERAVEVSNSENCTCALNSSDTISCWGNNEDGTCGINTTYVAQPRRIANLPEVVQIATTVSANCARTRGGEVFCWGESGIAQPPEGYHPDAPRHSAAPVRIPTPSDAQELFAGPHEACVVSSGGDVSCWGQAPGKWRPTLQPERSPPPRDSSTPLPAERAAELGFHDASILRVTESVALRCVLFAQGVVSCQRARWVSNGWQWGAFESVPLDAPVVDLRGSHHVCALTDSGDVYCWGSNHRGECGLDPQVLEPRELVLP